MTDFPTGMPVAMTDGRSASKPVSRGDLDWDGRLKSVADRGTGRHFTVQLGHRFGVSVRVQVDADPDCGKAGVPGCEAEEAAQVDVAVDRDLQILDRDAGCRRVGGVPDDEAVAQSG